MSGQSADKARRLGPIKPKSDASAIKLEVSVEALAPEARLHLQALENSLLFLTGRPLVLIDIPRGQLSDHSRDRVSLTIVLGPRSGRAR